MKKVDALDDCNTSNELHKTLTVAQIRGTTYKAALAIAVIINENQLTAPDIEKTFKAAKDILRLKPELSIPKPREYTLL